MKFYFFALNLGTLTIALVGVGANMVDAHGGDPNQIHTCVKGNGKLRIVGPNDSCRKNETPLDWNIQGPAGPPGQVNNMRDFTTDGTFTVPNGITRLVIEAWGGGGGGGGITPNQIGCDAGGGGGGGGGYIRGVIDVIPGLTYNVIIGTGGSGGFGNSPGLAGGDTSFTTSDAVVLIFAGGGGGGQPGNMNIPGAGGAGGQGNPNGGISVGGVSGNLGSAGSGFCAGPGDGSGGGSVIGARLIPSSSGGTGAKSAGNAGIDGGTGYLIIQW